MEYYAALQEERESKNALACEMNAFISKATTRERQVLEGVLRDLQNKEIAEELHVSVRTVKFHISSLLQKAGAKNRRELMVRSH